MRGTMQKLSGALLLALAGTASAEGMVALSLGQASYGEAVHTRQAADATSYKLYGGVAMSEHLSLHGGLVSLNSPHVTSTGINSYQDNSFSTHGAFGEARWQWRAGQAWRPYVKAGMGVMTQEAEISSFSTDPSTGQTTLVSRQKEAVSSATLVPGAGLVYETLDRWGVELQAERYLHTQAPLGAPAQDIDNIMLGVYAYW